MEYMEGEPKPSFDLSRIRHIIDARTVGSTTVTRTTHLLQYLYEVAEPRTSYDDPLTYLLDYLPRVNDLDKWVEDNEPMIDELKRQDPRDWHTDRYDLEQDIAPFATSAWMQTSIEACRMMSLSPELVRANIALKMLYRQASQDYSDVQAELRQQALNPPANPAA